MRGTLATYEQARQAAKDRMVELLDQDQASADLGVARRQTAEGAGVDTWDVLVADESQPLADVIGEGGESLAFLFCVTDRDEFTTAVRAAAPTLRNRLDDTTIPIDIDTARALLEIEVANTVEQVHPRFAGPVARGRVLA